MERAAAAGLVVALLLYSWGVFRLGSRRWKRRHDEARALLREYAEREAHEIDQRRRIEQETRALRGALTGALARLRR